MFGIGVAEIAIIGIVVVFAIGPDNVGHAVRRVGQWWAGD